MYLVKTYNELEASLKEVAALVEDAMDTLLPDENINRIGEQELVKAIRYSSFAKGKRLRPFLTVTSAALFGVSKQTAAQVAAAIEFVHTFSLIHDDLPALDDDDKRRGVPSLHKKFDEATAILAGDAMLAFAFEVLVHPTTHPDSKVRCDLVSALAEAVGTKGMVGGQMIDMLSEKHELSKEEVARMQRMKTGSLFSVSCEAGAILGKAPIQLRTALRAYAHDIGLAFQITDDLLDYESTPNSGRENKSKEKGTYVKLIGVEKARMAARMLSEQAITHLTPFDKKAAPLRELALYLVDRKK
jgi:farnesyl diphosphate synthase